MTLLANDAYGNTVDQTSDAVYDYYLVGGSMTYTFPTGTSLAVVYVTIAIQTNLLKFKAATQDYIQNLYPRDVQIQFLSIYLAAQSAGLTNRANYIGTLLTWLNGVLAYSASYVATVSALTNQSQIVASVFDSTQFSADPQITLLGAMTIAN